MHRALPEMLQSLNLPKNMSLLQRQQQEMIQQQEQQQFLSFLNGNDQQMSMFPQFQGLMNTDQGLGGGELLSSPMKQEPVVEALWSNCVGFTDYAIPRTISCPPAMADAAGRAKEATTTPPDKMNSAAGSESFKKRKFDKNQNRKVTREEEAKEKKMKGCATQGDSKITEKHSNNSNGETSGDASKENSKVSEVKKPDYIHVRARRGQATDSHSLAERVRREKISERMKFLQDLVPGCNKIVGKAGMLDEIINYVQSLQRQVEFLSMKLAAVNPTIDFNIDSFFPKEMFSAELSSEMVNPAHDLQFNPLQQVVTCTGIETSVSTDMALRRTISAPVSIPIPETLLDQSCFSQIQNSSTWDANNIQNFYALEFEQGKPTADPVFPQPFAGYVETGHVKLEI